MHGTHTSACRKELTRKTASDRRGGSWVEFLKKQSLTMHKFIDQLVNANQEQIPVVGAPGISYADLEEDPFLGRSQPSWKEL